MTTVLIVEDEVLIRMSGVAILEDAGFCVLDARDSAEAVEILALRSEINVLVTDVRMPGEMDGLALVAFALRNYPAIGSIVASSNTSAQDARNAGAIGFVRKPYIPQTMVQAVYDTISCH